MVVEDRCGRQKTEISRKRRDSGSARRICFDDAPINKGHPTDFQNAVPSSIPVQLPLDELCDLDVGWAMDKLHNQFQQNTAGLQYPGLGQFLASKSMPRFRKSRGLPFVQIINIGDHWICVTNVFSPRHRVVYIYDSLFSCVDHTTAVQVMLAT